MTNEELMKPRYKVIADYPHSPFKVGVILNVASDMELFSTEHGYPRSKWKISESDAIRCTSNFKKLEWWEDRKPEEMPECVNHKYDIKESDRIIKVQPDYEWSFWEGNCIGLIKVIPPFRDTRILIDYLTPATEEEYNNQ